MYAAGQHKSSSLRDVPFVETNHISACIPRLNRIDYGFKIPQSDEYLYTRYGHYMARTDNNTTFLSVGLYKTHLKGATFHAGNEKKKSHQSSRSTKRTLPQDPNSHEGKRTKKSRVKSNVYEYPIFRPCLNTDQQQPSDASIFKGFPTRRTPEERNEYIPSIETSSSSHESDDPFPRTASCHKEVGGGGSGGSGKPTSTTGSQGVSLYATAGPSTGDLYGLAY